MSEPSVSPRWTELVNKLHGRRIAENMILMEGMLRNEQDMSPIQRHLLANILSFIAAVYQRANIYDHFDTMLYEDKASRLIAARAFNSDDFFNLTDSNSEDYRMLKSLPLMLQNSSSVGGSRIDITPNIADEIITFLESREFHELLKKIITS